MAHKIKVVMGTTIKREAVLIDPNISANDNPQTGVQSKNIIERGSSSKEVASKHYGRN